MTPKPKPPPPRPSKPAPTHPENRSNGSFGYAKGTLAKPQRTVIYGPGGIGKSSLAALAERPIFLDLEHGTGHMDVMRVDPGEPWTWPLFVDALRRDDLYTDADAGTIVIDTGTAAEELAASDVLRTTKTSANEVATSVESYGYGKGYVYVYERFMQMLPLLDRHVAQGRNVVLICHDCTTKVPHPESDDYIRYEPRLQSPPAGKNSIRHRVREWADHVLYVGYDLAVKGGKATGRGTRTIYPTEQPWCMAKSRTLRNPIPFAEGDDALWQQLNP